MFTAAVTEATAARDAAVRQAAVDQVFPSLQAVAPPPQQQQQQQRPQAQPQAATPPPPAAAAAAVAAAAPPLAAAQQQRRSLDDGEEGEEDEEGTARRWPEGEGQRGRTSDEFGFEAAFSEDEGAEPEGGGGGEEAGGRRAAPAGDAEVGGAGLVGRELVGGLACT